MNELEKARRELKEQQAVEDGLMQAVHEARNRLFISLGKTLNGTPGDTHPRCNELVDMDAKDRPDHILTYWGVPHLESVDVHLQQLDHAEKNLAKYKANLEE